ncbi:MAG: CBS domain-containing protein [Acidobacteriaceae bacterium]
MSELGATVGTLLRHKKGDVWSVSPGDSVYDAIRLMAEKGIGSVLVTDGQRLVGILSERDYARKIALHDRSSKATKVSEIMTAPVTFVSQKHTVSDCMQIMTEERVRHLPVVDEGAIAGIISIGDLVNWIITEQQQTIRHLEAYITGVAA